jgi:Protein of unknown function (DUF3768)
MDNLPTIRALNADGSGGLVSVSAGIGALPKDEQSEILRHLQRVAAVALEDDPESAEDFSRFECAGRTIAWTTRDFEFLIRSRSVPPTEQWVTRRVLVVKLSQEA